jgi:putative tricarboxylic transport membrane protein
VLDALTRATPSTLFLRRSVLLGALAASAASPAPVLAQSTAPILNQLRIIAPAAPGGGWDQTARVMQSALQQAGIVQTAPVENIPGAAGTIGLARFIGAERGNGDAVLVSGLIMLGGIVTNQSPVSLGDATPLARLTGEYEAIVVPAASPYQSLQELLTAFKARPEAISWGGGSAGGSDQILAGLIAEAVGISPARVNYIAFSGGGESLSAIVGGQVTAGINGLAELAAQIEAGSVRALAISSGERLPGLAVPTLREQGVDVEFENWRSVMAPPGLDREERERLEATIQAMVQSAPWRAALERYRWIDRYLAGDAFARYVGAEEARVRAILKQFGTDEAEARTLMSTGPYPVFVLAGLVFFALASMAGPLRGTRPTRASDPLGGTRPMRASDSGTVGRVPQTVGRVPQNEEGGPAARGPAERRSATAIGWLAGGILAYLLLAERGGFVVASAALFWCTARAFDSRRPYRDAAFSIVISVSAFLLFARVLQLSLPAGILTGWL